MIGVNSQIESTGSSSGGQAGNVGIGFAIPSNTVKSVVDQLRATGKVSHAYLGVQTQRRRRAPAPRSARSPRGGPAANGGLQAGDVITSLGGKSVDDSERALLARRRAQGRRLGPGRRSPAAASRRR